MSANLNVAKALAPRSRFLRFVSQYHLTAIYTEEDGLCARLSPREYLPRAVHHPLMCVAQELGEEYTQRANAHAGRNDPKIKIEVRIRPEGLVARLNESDCKPEWGEWLRPMVQEDYNCWGGAEGDPDGMPPYVGFMSDQQVAVVSQDSLHVFQVTDEGSEEWVLPTGSVRAGLCVVLGLGVVSSSDELLRWGFTPA